ncbi:enoyl-CoA hydratase family protein [Janibacter alittae]|uniref:Enoyl-CoA hydratase family protein n=1 Tax=Janibacter alittae TaxID=3115209 RepID=A0ABZ2MKH7_9MICO
MSTQETQRRVSVTTTGSVTTVALDSPHNRNALSGLLVGQLREALEAAAADGAVRAVVLTHTGGTFCAGADLSEASAAPEDDPARARADELVDLLRLIVTLPKPVVGVVDGHVRAGGMGLVAACDIVLAGPSATFALTESRLGLAASVISLTVLPRIDPRAASRVFLTGEKFDAAEAARIGMVTESAQDLTAALDTLTGDLAKCSPQGLRESKALVNHELLAHLDEHRDRVAAQSSRLFSSEEAKEGMTAFLQRRAPRWSA